MSPRDAGAAISWKKKTERPRDGGGETEAKTKSSMTERQELGEAERSKLTPHGCRAGPQGPANRLHAVSCHGDKHAGNIQDN